MNLSSIKLFIKQLITFITHPILSFFLIIKGCKKFYIGPRLYLNNIKEIKIGNNFNLGHDARFLFIKNYCGEKYLPSLSIGQNCTILNRFTALCADVIEIQDNCLIASDVFITTENHGMNPTISESYADQPLTTKPVIIGKGCWIGEKVCILPGVELGEKCIAAAGSIITHSFPSYSLIGGTPAKILKRYNTITKKWEKA